MPRLRAPSSARHWSACRRSIRSRSASSAASSIRVYCGSRSAGSPPATPATGRRFEPGRPRSRRSSTTGKPHPTRGITAASFSRPPDEDRAGRRQAESTRSELTDGDSAATERELKMRKVFEIGGIVAAAVLVAFGVAAIVMGINGRSTVRDSLKLEQIVGSPDMTPTGITAEAKQAGLKTFQVPSLAVAGKPINSGDRARAFAGFMRIHTLEATGGLTY